MKEIAQKLKDTKLFIGLNEEEILTCLKSSDFNIEEFEKDETIFHVGDKAKHINVLIDGAVSICRDSMDGKRSIVAIFNTVGAIFGEVFLFLENKGYEHYARAASKVKLLKISKDYLFEGSKEGKDYHKVFLGNMLSDLAFKNYYLNRKVQILSCSSLRQKIAMFLIQNMDRNKRCISGLGREEMADLLNTARPSLSRELMKMQEEGIIEIDKKHIIIKNIEALENL